MNIKTFSATDPVHYLDQILKALNSSFVYYGSNRAKKSFTHESVWIDIVKVFKTSCANGGKLIFIGNGGSAAIAGHMALDFSNRGGLRAICFNDGPLLTCLANDYSYENVFLKAINIYANPEDVLIAISSSGQSENVLRGVDAATKKGCKVITFSGFDKANPLRKLGELNVHVSIPRPNYGLVEVSHHIILHFILDYILENPA